MTPSRRILLKASVVALGAAALRVRAQSLAAPTGIRLVVPFPAGGSSDRIARILAAPLSDALGQPVAVENMAGPDGLAAAEAVRRAPPDGTTLLFATATGFSGAPVLRRDFPFDPVVDFTPVCKLGTYAFFLFVSEQLPVRSVAELVDHARAHPGKLSYGSATATSGLATAQLARLADLQMTPVTFAGDAPLIAAALDGRIQLMFAAGGTALPHLRSGRLRALATLLPERSALLPEVPTMAQAGFEVSITPWGGVFGPPGMPAGTVERLNRALVGLLARADIRARLVELAFEPQSSSPQELGAFVGLQLRDWRQAAVAAGMAPR